MIWPWISRKRHEAEREALLDYNGSVFELARRAQRSHLDCCKELGKVRLELIAARNKCATLDGQLAAERHGKGLPAALETQ